MKAKRLMVVAMLIVGSGLAVDVAQGQATSARERNRFSG